MRFRHLTVRAQKEFIILFLIKMIVLSGFLIWLFLRTFKNQQGKKYLKLFKKTILGLIAIAMAWWLFAAFGPSQYIIHSDSYGQWSQKNTPVFVAWKQNRFLPTKAFATPVFMLGDRSVIGEVPDNLLSAVNQRYPYEGGENVIRNMLISGLLSISFLFFLMLQNKKVTVRWKSVSLNENMVDYRLFLKWTNSHIVKKLISGAKRRSAEKWISEYAREKLRLQMLRKGWKNHDVEAPFLEIVSYLTEKEIQDINLVVQHKPFNTFNLPVSESQKEKGDFLFDIKTTRANVKSRIEYHLSDRAIDDRKLLHEKGELKQTDNVLNRFGLDVFICPEPLQLVAPDIEFSEKAVTKHINNAFMAGLEKFACSKLLRINANESNRLEIDFNCYVQQNESMFSVTKSNSERTKNSGGIEFINTGTEQWQVDGETVEGGNLSYFRLGMVFNYRLIITGSVVKEGTYSCLPDATLVRMSTPEKRIKCKQDAEEKIFDANAFSCVNNLFSRLMGIDAGRLNKHQIMLNEKVTTDVEQTKSERDKFLTQFEDALREETLEELLSTSAEHLYQQNKAEVDVIVIGYLRSLDSPETIAQAVAILRLSGAVSEGLLAVLEEVTND